MTLNEAIGIKYADIDSATGERVPWEEIQDRKIEFLGGLDAVKPFIPFDIPYIAEKAQEDYHLNNTDMMEWDLASGFITKKGECIPVFGGIWYLYRQHGINAASNAEGVCILKHAAKRLADQYLGENENGR